MTHRLALAVGLLAAGLAVAGPALAADPIMPLAQVRSDMRCTGLSVIRGTTISRFDVEVIDVIRGDSAALGPRILVRASGPALQDTGLGPGFSGSPILCPDQSGTPRNIGAISEGIGDYGNEMALVTPIERILGERPEAPRGSRSGAAVLRRARPFATPLTVTGLSGPMRALFTRGARRAGRPVFAAPPGPLAGFPVQDLRPGASVAVGVSSGDVSVGAVGTVAYRDGSGIWAFGHSLDGVGRRALLLQDAYVFSVVGNPVGFEGASTYKLALPGHTVGSLTNDGLEAVVGRIGAPPPTIGLTVTVRDSDTGRTSTLRSQVSDERQLELGSGLDLVGSLALGQASSEVLGSTPPRTSSTMCLRIAVTERARPLGFCDEYVDSATPFEDLSAALALLDGFKLGRVTPTSVSVRMGVSREAPEAFLLGAGGPRAVRAGQRVPVRLALRRSRGRRFVLSFGFRVPRSTPPGQHRLRVSGPAPESGEDGAAEAIELFLEDPAGGLPGEGAGPRSLDALSKSIAELGEPDGIRATLARKGRGQVALRTPRLLVRGRTSLPLRVLPPR